MDSVADRLREEDRAALQSLSPAVLERQRQRGRRRCGCIDALLP
jgi:hypothetical protein